MLYTLDWPWTHNTPSQVLKLQVGTHTLNRLYTFCEENYVHREAWHIAW